MITEKVFSAQFSDFWRSTLPNLEAVTRSANIAYNRITNPTSTDTNPHRRDLISESGYRYFLGLLEEGPANREERRRRALSEAKRYIESNFSYGGEPLDDVDDVEMAEITSMVRWLQTYFSTPGARDWRDRISQPKFRGHGMISPCIGDFEIDGRLIEMKYVDRGFRSQDLRQALIYSGLRYYEKGSTFTKISLINPLRGIEFTSSPREIVYSASGTEVIEFFQELSYTLSSGETSH